MRDLRGLVPSHHRNKLSTDGCVSHKERGERNEGRRRGSETENGDSLVTQVDVIPW